MQYYTDSNRPKVKFQKPGQRFEPIYKERLNSKGEKILKIVGKTDVLTRAQTDKDSCNINKTMEKYGITTADSVRRLLNNEITSFVDEVYDDSDVFERHNKLVQAQEDFNKLDSKVKSYFGNSFSKFYNSVIQGSIYDDLKKIDPKTVSRHEENLIQEQAMQNQAGGEINEK